MVRISPALISSFILHLILLSIPSRVSAHEYDEIINKINASKLHSKLSSCLSIVRNNLNQRDKNKGWVNAMNTTKFDRGLFYDKAIAQILVKCTNNIKTTEISIASSPGNVLNTSPELINKWKHLIDIDYSSITGVEWTQEERTLWNEIKVASSLKDQLASSNEDEIGFMGMKREQISKLSYLFLVIGIALFVTVVLGGWYYWNRESHAKKEKTKAKKMKKK